MFGARSGVGGLLFLLAILYFSGAGSWLQTRIQRLSGVDVSCYNVLSQVSVGAANSVCGTLTSGMAAMGNISQQAEEIWLSLKQAVSGLFGGASVDNYLAEMSQKVSGLTSSREALERLMQQGPSALGQSFQQAVDSFAIGNQYLQRGGNAAQALPWLQQGAAQPQGFGLMSQLALGQLFANGGQGVPANPQVAQFYLQQAQQSLGVLSGSNSPQAQQLLQTLPASPQQIMNQITSTLRQMQPRPQ